MKPLTIEELKALPVGEWIWGIDLRCEEFYYMLKVNKLNDEEYEESFFIAPDGDEYDFSDYGTRWIAYKNKEHAEGKYDKETAKEILHDLYHILWTDYVDEEIGYQDECIDTACLYEDLKDIAKKYDVEVDE